MKQRPGTLVVGGVPFAVTKVQPGWARPDLGDFLGVVRALVRAGKIALLDGPMTAYGARRELGWPALVDTIDDCALVAVADLGIGTRRPGDASAARVIGPIATVRLMASYAEPVPPLAAIFEPTPVRTDFRAFTHLWATAPEDPFFEPDPFAFFSGMERKLKVVAIGELMAKAHNRVFWLWDDAHEGNMGFQVGEGLKAFDKMDSRVLYGPPSPAQCATTLVPLMSSFSPTDWQGFRAGYIAERGADGERVIDFIESRDFTGWMQATRRDDLDEAARLLSNQLETDVDLPATVRPGLQSILGVLLSRAGRHAEALAAHRTAVAAAGDDGAALANARFNLGQALLRAGDAPAAVTPLEQVVAGEREAPTVPGLLEAAIEALEEARALAG